MTYSDIEKEYSSYMKDASFQLGYSHIPKFVNVNDYLCAAKSKMMKMAIEKMPYQVFALDRAIEVLIMLTEMFEVPNKDSRRTALYAQLRRSSTAKRRSHLNAALCSRGKLRMADIRVFINQGRYDHDSKRLFVIRENAINTGSFGIQDAAEQRIKKCYPKLYQ